MADESTKEKLVRTAAELFAKKGPTGVSVRDICEKARANIAMISYHFKNKEGLYREVIDRLFKRPSVAPMFRLHEKVTDVASWKQAVTEWVRDFDRIPKGYFRQEAARYAEPLAESFRKILRKVCTDEEKVRMWTTSVLGQLAANNIVEHNLKDKFAAFVTRQIFKDLEIDENEFQDLKKLACIAIAAMLIAGCANPGREERERVSRDFETNLVAETESVLREQGGTLLFTNAVALARARSLKLTRQNLDAQLSRINRATAFSAFLPNVELAAGRSVFNLDVPQVGLPLVGTVFGGTYNRNYLNVGTLQLTQPVFTPVAWVMFAESCYGVRIKEIIRDRARQLLDLQVAALFYRDAIAERMVAVYAAQVAGGEALTNRVSALAREGYALESDALRTRTRLAHDQLQLEESRRDAVNARAKLCEILRLWPLADMKVDGDSLLSAVGTDIPGDPSLPEAIWTALVSRRELYAGDQTIELRKAQVLEALAGFLPNVVGSAGGMSGSLGSAAVSAWSGGLLATWSVFSGFRTVQAYRAARAQREAEFQLQEDRMLGVVTAVIDAWHNRGLAERRFAVAALAAETARRDYAIADLRFREGEETMSTVLDKLAAQDAAEVQLVSARYGTALAELVYRQAVGEEIVK